MSTPLNPDGLQVCQLFNQVIPSEGPRSIPLILDFSAADSYTLDLAMFQQRGWFSMLQSIYIDMQGSTADNFTFKVKVTGQTLQEIVVQSRAQGYYQILCANPAQLEFSCADTNRIAKVQLINVPIPGVVWFTGD